jgi:hypothetical protein
MYAGDIIMNIRTIIPLTVLFSAIPHQAAAVMLDAEILRHADGSVIDWKVISDIVKYRSNVKKFLSHEYTIDATRYRLIDLALCERDGRLPVGHTIIFTEMVDGFMAFSESFIEALRPLKGALASLITESCEKRNQTNSLLLRWATSKDGAELDLFRQKINTYRLLGELCTELLHFTEDLLHSLPKALAAHEEFFARVVAIEPIIDTLLKADDIYLSHSSKTYHDLVRYVAEMYSIGEAVSKEKTTRLYNNYKAKHTL